MSVIETDYNYLFSSHPSTLLLSHLASSCSSTRSDSKNNINEHSNFSKLELLRLWIPQRLRTEGFIYKIKEYEKHSEHSKFYELELLRPWIMQWLRT